MADRVLGVLGGGDMPDEVLRAWAQSADVVIAADGGANPLIDEGLRVDVLIGDLDSASEASKSSALKVVHDEDQHSTDVDKLLAFVAEQGYSAVTLASVEGDRLDHLLGTLSSALRSPLRVRFALRSGLAWLLRPSEILALDLPVGRSVSLLPLVACEGTRLQGVRWPIEGAVLALDAMVSVSNETMGGMIEVSIDRGAAIFVVEFALSELPQW